MERLARKDEKRNGITRNGLRLWGIVLLVLGAVGQGIIQHRLLGLGSVTSDQLLEAMIADESVMVLSTLALVMQVAEVCAVPIFCLLLAEGFEHTKDPMKYLLRVLGVAAVSEIPYNLALSGTWVDLSSRNPVFGLVFALILLLLYQRFEGKSMTKRLIRVVMTVAGLLWCVMLGIRDGFCIVALVVVFWLCRNKKQMRTYIGCGAAACCSLLNYFFLAAPMGFLPIYFYRGERGEENKLVNYLAYPALLTAVALAGSFL